jgi:hypothetical protein
MEGQVESMRRDLFLALPLSKSPWLDAAATAAVADGHPVVVAATWRGQRDVAWSTLTAVSFFVFFFTAVYRVIFFTRCYRVIFLTKKKLCISTTTFLIHLFCCNLTSCCHAYPILSHPPVPVSPGERIQPRSGDGGGRERVLWRFCCCDFFGRSGYDGKCTGGFSVLVVALFVLFRPFRLLELSTKGHPHHYKGKSIISALPEALFRRLRFLLLLPFCCRCLVLKPS